MGSTISKFKGLANICDKTQLDTSLWLNKICSSILKPLLRNSFELNIIQIFLREKKI